MSDNLSPGVREFYDGAVDQTAIAAYLDVKDDGEIARLAALMAPRQNRMNPAKLVEAAFALQDEVICGLIRRRENLVKTMNYPTLLGLLDQLNTEANLYIDEDDERLKDPVIGPPLRKLQLTASEGMKQGDLNEKKRIHDALENTASKTTIPRPNYPCSLEDAIRHATDSPDHPWPALRKSFIDFLGIFRIAREKADLDDQIDDLNRTIDHLRAVNHGLESKGTQDQRSTDSKKRHLKELEANQAKLDDLIRIRHYHEHFKPDLKAPKEVEEESEKIYAHCWSQPNSVKSDSSLAWLATDFHAFWLTHRKTYLTIHAAEEKITRKKKSQAKKAAARAAASREGGIWIAQTENFVKFAMPRNAKPGAYLKLIEDFSSNHSGRSSTKAQMKVREFIGLMWTYTDRKFDWFEIEEILRKKGFKAIDENAISKCVELLKTKSHKGKSK